MNARAGNLAGKAPLGLKEPKAKPDPAYLARVRELPCAVCDAFGELQQSPTEAHHVKSERFGRLRTPDRMAIPLCHSHHHKLRAYCGDEAKIGFHNAQENWEARYGLDHEYTAATQDKLGV